MDQYIMMDTTVFGMNCKEIILLYQPKSLSAYRDSDTNAIYRNIKGYCVCKVSTEKNLRRKVAGDRRETEDSV